MSDALTGSIPLLSVQKGGPKTAFSVGAGGGNRTRNPIITNADKLLYFSMLSVNGATAGATYDCI